MRLVCKHTHNAFKKGEVYEGIETIRRIRRIRFKQLKQYEKIY